MALLERQEAGLAAVREEGKDSGEFFLKSHYQEPRSEVENEITLTIGEDRHEVIRWSWYRTSKVVQSIIERVRFTPSADIDLVRIKVGELDTPRMPSIDQILKGAKHLGLQACPAEVGPQLIRKNPAKSYNVYIGMEPIKADDGLPYVFKLDDGLKARGADRVFGPNDEFLFVRPQKAGPPPRA